MVDDRLRNIREGAGKEDSRYSELMTDLLNKVGPWVVGAVLVFSGGYLAYTYYEKKQSDALSAAFFQLEKAIDSGSPKSLEAVAEEHAGQRAVTRVAEVELGDIYLGAARRGVAPGATLTPEGLAEQPEDMLPPEKVTEYVTRAGAAYQSTYDATKDDQKLALHTIRALFGMAAVAETKGDFEAASRHYADAAARATANGFDPLATMANKRKESVGTLTGVGPLFKTAELPARIEAASPFPTPPSATGATTGTSTMNVTPAPGSGPTIIKGSGPLPTEGPVGPQVPPSPAPAPATPSATPPAATPPATTPPTPPATPPAAPKR